MVFALSELIGFCVNKSLAYSLQISELTSVAELRRTINTVIFARRNGISIFLSFVSVYHMYLKLTLHIRRCVLNWFGDWSNGALYQVGKEFTNKIDLDKTHVSIAMLLSISFLNVH